MLCRPRPRGRKSHRLRHIALRSATSSSSSANTPTTTESTTKHRSSAKSTSKTAKKSSETATSSPPINPHSSIHSSVDSARYPSVFDAAIANGATTEMCGTVDSPFVSAAWLNHQITTSHKAEAQSFSYFIPNTSTLRDPNLHILNASWQAFYDTSMLSLYQSFLSSRIPTAQFIDLQQASISSSPKPLTFSTVEDYCVLLSQLGITPEHSIVLYDYNGLHGAAYAHWILSAIGFDPKKLRILSGGWQSWIQNEANPIESTPYDKSPRFNSLPTSSRSTHTPSFSPQLKNTLQKYLISDDEMFDIGYAHYLAISNGFVDTRLPLIIDTRSVGRYLGKIPEPTVVKSHVLAGHVPGSINVPYASLVKSCPVTGCGTVLKNQQELEEIFLQSFVELPSDRNHPIVVMSGLGTTSTVAHLALKSLGYQNVRVYAGSWATYGDMAFYPRVPRPIEVGPGQNALLNPQFSTQARQHYTNLLTIAASSQAQLVYDPVALKSQDDNQDRKKLSPIMEVLASARKPQN